MRSASGARGCPGVRPHLSAGLPLDRGHLAHGRIRSSADATGGTVFVLSDYRQDRDYIVVCLAEAPEYGLCHE